MQRPERSAVRTSMIDRDCRCQRTERERAPALCSTPMNLATPPAGAARVLLVDDDRELSSMLVEYLRIEGFDPVAVDTGELGVAAALRERFDVIVLDLMLPGIGGTEVLRQLREHSQVPVVMLTARGDPVDRIVGLELGADDYVPKPCPPRELVARLRAILRRTRPQESTNGVLQAGPLVLQPARRRAQCGEAPLILTATEFNLLEVLVRAAGRVVPKQDLYRRGLGRPMNRFERSLDVHVSSIRAKLAQAAGSEVRVETVRGIGYQLVTE